MAKTDFLLQEGIISNNRFGAYFLTSLQYWLPHLLNGKETLHHRVTVKIKDFGNNTCSINDNHFYY